MRSLLDLIEEIEAELEQARRTMDESDRVLKFADKVHRAHESVLIGGNSRSTLPPDIFECACAPRP